MRVSITTALTVGAFICAAASTGKAVPFYEQQRPFSIIERQPQELQGRFLHLTDLHVMTFITTLLAGLCLIIKKDGHAL